MRRKEERIQQLQQVAMMLVGTFLMAFCYYHINFQNNLAEGGFVGLALLGKYAFDWSPAVTMLMLDIPIFIVAMFVKGRKFLLNTVIAAVSLSVFYDIFEQFSPLVIDLKNYMLVAAVLAGVITGFGAGIVIRFGGATGGDDILALFLSKWSGFTVGTMFFILDAVVLLLSLVYLPIAETLYTILAVSIAGKMITWVVGFGFSKNAVSIAARN
ncbi:YitT family protein [Paenibacillus guangzhouensis]|uniref:YitT family protein n=1 Tax=Paenibacillus guangzhouensis TaxID=1473112 RepID=UPI001266A735|nr:YitT family protein [Paenibacillus guangzhouensis]